MKATFNSDPVARLGGGITMKKSHMIGITFIVLILLYVLTSSLRSGWGLNTLHSPGHHGHAYSVWPEYKTPSYSHTWFKKNCWVEQDLSISSLSTVVDSWSRYATPLCRSVYKKLMSIYEITTLKTSVVIKTSFEEKVKKWLGNDEDLFNEVKHQTIIKVFNLYTHENVLINPLRDKRPITKPEKPERELVEEWVTNAKASCDFCNYQKYTASDEFPPIENKHSISASNTFKWDKWHGLIIPKEHHPLNWNEEQFLDLMQTALEWFAQVKSIDPDFIYPVIVWDLLPHASASQIHPHIHTNLNSKHYYGYIENWRAAGEQYAQDSSSNFFTDMVGVHQALGLTVQLGNATALAHLVPRRDHEVIVVSAKPDTDFFKLLYYTLRAYMDDMEKLCFSLAISFPSLGDEREGRLPAFARVVTRGSVSSLRSDISSVDLFVASNVNIDPYKVINYVSKSVQRRSQGH